MIYLYFALGNMLFLFCYSHLPLAVILVCFGVLNFHSLVLECVCGGGGGVGGGEKKQESYEICKTS